MKIIDKTKVGDMEKALKTEIDILNMVPSFPPSLTIPTPPYCRSAAAARPLTARPELRGRR